MMMDVFLSKSQTNTNGGANTAGAWGSAVALQPIQVAVGSIEGQWLWPAVAGCGPAAAGCGIAALPGRRS